MFDFMSQAQTAHNMQQQMFDDQNRLHEQATRQAIELNNNRHVNNSEPSAEHVSNAAYIESLRSKIKTDRERIAAESEAFDKEWEAHRKSIADFDINDFSSF